MKRFLTIVIMMIIMVSCVPVASAIEDAPTVQGGNVMLVNVNTGATIYEKNADEQIYPASTTKLMTMAVAIELIDDLEATITFDKKACYSDFKDDDGREIIGVSNMGLVNGEIISIKDLLYGIALSSANEGTNALAIHLCGDIPTFVEKMNQKAAAWGMTETHFVNTHGLHREQHYTTARDMSIMAQKVLSDERLLPYLSAGSYRLPATNKSGARTLTSTNQLIRRTSENYYKYAVAGKTGTTTPAGYNLISLARYKGMEYICVMMNADRSLEKNPVFSDSASMFKWAFANFGMKTLLDENESVEEVKVSLCAKSDYVVLVPETPIEAVVANDADVDDRTQFKWEVVTNENVQAPIAVGDVLGTITIVRKEGDKVVAEYGTVNLVASTDLDRSNILYYLHLIRQFFSNKIVLIVAIVVVVLIILYIIFMIWQNNRRRRRRIARRIRF